MQRRVLPDLPWLALPAFLALVCLVGCAPLLTFGSAPKPPQPTATVAGEFSRLDVLRTSPWPQDHIPAFAATVTDPTKIDQLYLAIVALPAGPGNMFCPAGSGAFDQLVFHSTTFRFQVDIDTGGCEGVYFAGLRNPPERWTGFSTSFWQLFAQTLGVPESTVKFWPSQPHYTGPYAPTPSA